MKYSFFTILIVFISLNIYGQTGTIMGKVMDTGTGEFLIGADVILTGTTNRTVTDPDGEFTLKNIPAGNQSISISYISYQTKVFKDVEVSGGKVTLMKANLVPSSHEIENVVVTTLVRERTESYADQLNVDAGISEKGNPE